MVIGVNGKLSSQSVVLHTASLGDVVGIHRNLVSKFKLHLSDEIIIGTSRNNDNGWKKAAITNDPIRFQMWSKQSFDQAPRKGERSSCPIVRLEDIPFGEVPWVAWSDEWLPSRQNRGKFEFKTASLTFFWGRAAGGAIEQIFRAEWVEPEHGSNDAATPHWHIDWQLADIGKSMSGIHLAMAGWEEDGVGVKCWQKGVKGNWGSLSVWAERTLFYAKHQLKHFPLAEE